MESKEDKICFRVPIYPKKTKCIGCGCSVGTRTKNNIKKAISIGMEKAIEFWNNQQLVVHYNDHKLCSTCFNLEELEIGFKMSSNGSDFKTLSELFTLYFKRNNKIEKKIEKMENNIELDSNILHITKLSANECVECCGLNLENLNELSHCSGCSVQVVFEFFCKCRQRVSDRFGGVLFQKDHSAISHNFERVLDRLTDNFVSKWLGSSAFTRESIILENTPYLFKQIIPDVRGEIDGTYFYIEKSSVFDVQRKTYSGHKGRNLIKEMGIILPNGKIFDLIGPFFSDGDHSDEWMWSYIMDNNCGDIKKVFDLQYDEFLADRGFLNINKTEGMFKLKCPIGLSPNKKQLSTEEANNSRLVTRFRNVVERVFGRLKSRWKIIDDVIPSGLWPKFHQLLRLLAAIENAFSPPL